MSCRVRNLKLGPLNVLEPQRDMHISSLGKSGPVESEVCRELCSRGYVEVCRVRGMERFIESGVYRDL